MPVRALSHFGLCVVDPQRSIRFYRDLLGRGDESRDVESDAPGADEIEEKVYE